MTMKKVLIVDDEEDMLWMLQRNLDNGIPNIETFTAQSGDEALNIIDETEMNLIITDINMPGISGLELLTEVSRRFPDTKVIIMTAYPSNTFENKAKKEGAVQFVEKPFDINDMRKTVEESLESSATGATAGGIALIDIIQFNGLANASTTLKVTAGEKKGMIFFQEGKVVHCSFGENTDETAFFEIIEAEGAELHTVNDADIPAVTMGKTVESLMLEAAVLKDEIKSKEANGTGPLTPVSGEAAALLPDDEPDQAAQETEMQGKEILEPQKSDNTEDEEMTEIQKILAEFTNIDGVHTACLVGRDGFLLDSIARTGIDAEMIGAIASSGFGSAESMGMQLGQGDLTMTMLEYNDGPVMFSPVGSEAFLVIVADKDTNLGWIRIAIKKNSAKIEQIAAI